MVGIIKNLESVLRKMLFGVLEKNLMTMHEQFVKFQFVELLHRTTKSAVLRKESSAGFDHIESHNGPVLGGGRFLYHVPFFCCHCEERSDVAIRIPSGALHRPSP